MFAAITNQVDNYNKKVIIFTLNPQEQQLYSVLINLIGYKSLAYLLTIKSNIKANIIRDFQSLLAQQAKPSYNSVKLTNYKVLILSYYINSSLNLHITCYNLYALSPLLLYSIQVQSISYIAHFSQAFKCCVIAYIMLYTYNVSQYSSIIKNALFIITALTYTIHAKGNRFNTVLQVSFLELKYIHSYKDTLVNNQHPRYTQLVVSSKVNINLDTNKKFLRILNVILGKTIQVTTDTTTSYKVTKVALIFQNYCPLLVVSKVTYTLLKNSPISSLTGTLSSSSKGRSKALQLILLLLSKQLARIKEIEDSYLSNNKGPYYFSSSNSNIAFLDTAN